MRHFSDINPYIQLLFFLVVLIMIMFTVNPAVIFFSVIGGLVYTVILERKKFISRLIMIPLCSMLFAVINAALSHNGVNVLFYMNDRRITSEAFFYGAFMGVVLSDMIVWTMCMSKIMTKDRLVYVFGRFPVLSVVVSMTFRYIPLFTDKYRNIKDYSIISGTYNDMNYFTRIKGSLGCLMTLITWILENGADTAGSMEKRGFMSGKRSRFMTYRIRAWDLIVVAVSLLTSASLVYLKYRGNFDISFYPVIEYRFSVFSVILVPVFFLPVILELKEEIKWKYLISKI